jgi:hypothetical protein
MSPNEGRQKMDMKPVEGGESPYLQQQNYSLAALAKRDAQDDPFGKSEPAALPAPAENKPAPEDNADAGADPRDYADIILRAAKRHEQRIPV